MINASSINASSASRSEKLIRQKVFDYAKNLRVDLLLKNSVPTEQSKFIYQTLKQRAGTKGES